MLMTQQEQDQVLVFAPVKGIALTLSYDREEVARALANMVASWVYWVAVLVLRQAEKVVELGRSCRASTGRWVARQGGSLAQKRELALEQLEGAGVLARATGRRVAVALAAVVLPPVFGARARLEAGKSWLQGYYLRYTAVLTLPPQ
jgi:hypothetical protein